MNVQVLTLVCDRTQEKQMAKKRGSAFAQLDSDGKIVTTIALLSDTPHLYTL